MKTPQGSQPAEAIEDTFSAIGRCRDEIQRLVFSRWEVGISFVDDYCSFVAI